MARAPKAPPRPGRTPGKYERLCWERNARDLALAYPPEGELPADPRRTAHPRGLWFHAAAGERVVQFIERYAHHSKGEWAGALIELDALQRQALRIIFGWMRPDGTRRFRVAWIELPRKNAKSTLAAAVGLYLTVGDDEPGAEVYSSATKREQAKIVHALAASMVKASPELKRYLRAFRNNLSCERLGSKFEPVGADSDRLDGLNVHGHIADEVHAHKDRGLWDVLETAKGARRQPLTLAITTAGVYDPEAIGWQLHDHATKVLEGLEDDELFALICAADEGDDWTAPATWYKANPLLGVAIKESYLATQVARAKTSPSFQNTVLRAHLNLWTQQVTRWIPLEQWNACAGPVPDLAGRPVYLGLDLATKHDFTALAIVAPAADGSYDATFRFWMPEGVVADRERRRELPSYAPWVRDGWLRTTPGDVTDFAFIRAEINRLRETLDVRQIGYDPWAATQLALQLTDDGFTTAEMRQGPRTLSEPSKELEKLVIARQLRHDGNPVMAWMVGNATVRTDANGNIAPSRDTAGGKVDGVLALVNALGRAMLGPAAGGEWDFVTWPLPGLG